jgi:type III pantothenate kinase
MSSKDAAVAVPLLTVDVGNTSIAFGLFETPTGAPLAKTAKIPSHPLPSAERLSREILRFLGARRAQDKVHVIIGSVVPALTSSLSVAVRPYSRKVVVVTSREDFGFKLAVDVPSALGADRIANVSAAWTLLQRPVAVADFGSATTISIMDGAAFLGGAILPGISMMRDALFRKTARLPQAPLHADIHAVGVNTSAAIRSGVVLGTAGAVEKIVFTAEKELGRRLSLVVTGGNASLVLPHLRRKHHFTPDLTLQGYRLIFLRRLDLSS